MVEPTPAETSDSDPSPDSAHNLGRDRAPALVSRLVLAEPSPRTATAFMTVPAAGTPTVAPDYTGFRKRLVGRVLVVTGGDAEKYADIIDDTRSGLVASGKSALKAVRRLSAAYPHLMLAVDPWRSEKAYASEDAPFILETDDDEKPSLLAPPTLDDDLWAQINAGASFAVTPTGVMQAGDRRTLKKAVEEVSGLDRDDMVFYVPLEPGWFTPDNIKGLIGVLAKCTHPVAIAIADVNGDPYTKVLKALRLVVAALPYAIIWRVDLAGLDLMAHGAKAACVGVLPAKRAAPKPGSFRRASDKTDRTPQVLCPELLRYVRTRYMRDEWYAATKPPPCTCTVCEGRAIDRFTKSTQSRLEAHRHNAVTLLALIHDVASPVGDRAWWRQVAIDAVAEHATLGGQIGRKMKPPASVDAFAHN